jgi:hypothetical protein
MSASYFVKMEKALQVSLLYTTLAELNPAQLGIRRPSEALSGLILGQTDVLPKATQLSGEPTPTGKIRIATRRHLRLLHEHTFEHEILVRMAPAGEPQKCDLNTV